MTGHFIHYGIEVRESKLKQDHWEIVFNKEGGGEVSITMDLPKRGVFEDTAAVVDKPLAERLADMIASIIRNTLTSPGGEQQ